MCSFNQHDNYLFQEINNHLSQMSRLLHKDKTIPHYLWAACIRDADLLFNSENLSCNTRVKIIELLEKESGIDAFNIIQHLEHRSTRHYFFALVGLCYHYPILHQGITKHINGTLTCTCRSFLSTDSILSNLPPCCQEAIYYEAEKKLLYGQAAKLIIGNKQLPNHVHFLGLEKERIVISEISTQLTELSIMFPSDRSINTSAFIKCSERILGNTYILSDYWWDDKTTIQFNGCQSYQSLLYSLNNPLQIQ